MVTLTVRHGRVCLDSRGVAVRVRVAIPLKFMILVQAMLVRLRPMLRCFYVAGLCLWVRDEGSDRCGTTMFLVHFP